MKHKKFLLLLIIFWLMPVIQAQQIDIDAFGKGQAVTITGSVSANSVFLNTNRPGSWQNFTYFLQGNLNLKLYQFSVPVSYNYTNQGANFNYRLPFNLNRLSIHPKYKWIQAHIGDVSMNFSPYTLNGHQFTGGGLDLMLPANFKLSIMAGRMLKAVEDDDKPGTLPAFKRMGYGIKLGFNKTKYSVNISSFYAKDELNSLNTVPEAKNILPKENLALSIEGDYKIFKNLSLNILYATSAITNDIRFGQKNASAKNLSSLFFNNKTNTEYYTAYKAKFNYLINKTNVGITYEHVDPGYRTLGAHYFNNDLENITLNASQPMFNSKLNLTFNMGYQRDNLNFSKLMSTNRMVGSVNMQFHPNNKLNINGSYSNFSTYTNQKLNRLDDINQINNTPEQLQQLDYKQLSQNGNLNINWVLSQSKTRSNNLNFNYSLASSYNSQGGIVHIGQANNFHNAIASYMLGFPEKKLNITTSVNYSYNDIATNNSSGIGTNISIAKKFLDGKLSTSFTTGYNSNNNNQIKTQVITANLRLSMRVKRHNFNFAAINLYRNAGHTGNINEFRLNFGYTYSFDVIKSKKKK